MKFLLLLTGLTGLACYVAGLYLYFKNDAEHKKKSNIWLILGALLMIAGFFCFGYSVHNKIDKTSVVLVIVFVPISFYKIWRGDSKWVGASIIFILLILFYSFGSKLPPVTLDNGIIKMEGKYGGVFNVSEIQSIDIISVIPRTGAREGGGSLTTTIGNFNMQNESKRAKLRIYRNKPPYIKIRMSDNRLFIFNFKEPEKTVEFYDELNALRVIHF